jgi:hypothetical protein
MHTLRFEGRQFISPFIVNNNDWPEELTRITVFACHLDSFVSLDPAVAEKMIGKSDIGTVRLSTAMVKDQMTGTKWVAKYLGLCDPNKEGIEVIVPVYPNQRQNAYLLLSRNFEGKGGIQRLRIALEGVMHDLSQRSQFFGGSEAEGLRAINKGINDSITYDAQGNQRLIWGNSKLVDSALYFVTRDLFEAGIKSKTIERELPYEGWLHYKDLENAGIKVHTDWPEKLGSKTTERYKIRMTVQGYVGPYAVSLMIPREWFEFLKRIN